MVVISVLPSEGQGRQLSFISETLADWKENSRLHQLPGVMNA